MHPTTEYLKRTSNWSLTTHQISVQSVLLFPRYQTLGNVSDAHPHDLWICIATWTLTTHQIWWQSARPFLSYSLAGNFDTLHAARATRQADPSNESNLVAVNFYGMRLPDSEKQGWHFCWQKLVIAICRFKPAKTGKNSKCIIKLLLAMCFNMRHCMAQVTAVNDQSNGILIFISMLSILSHFQSCP